jgi:hypothetical protein
MIEMSEQLIDVISIIPLLFGSLLMLASGAGFISSRYSLLAGLLCFLLYGLIEGIFKRKFGVKRDRQ